MTAGAAGSAVRLVRFVLVRTVVEPVRSGHLRSAGWPPGLRPVAVVAVTLYGVLMLSAVFANAFRRTDRLLVAGTDQTFPALGLPLVLLGMILALSCLFTAGLHLRVPLRIAVTVFVVAVLLYPVAWGGLSSADAVILGLTAILPLVLVLRWRSTFHWGELVVALVVVGHAVVVFQTWGLAVDGDLDPGLQLSQLYRVTSPMWALAVPVAVLAGAALVEITTAAATWTATGVWQLLDRRRSAGTRRWSAVVLGLLVVARVAQEARRLRDPGDPVAPGELLVAAAVGVVVLAACSAVTALADRVPHGDAARRPDPDDLLPVWSRYAWVLALVTGAGVSGLFLLSVVVRASGQVELSDRVRDLGGASVGLVLAVVTSLLALVAAVVQAGRGRRLAPVLLVTFAVFFGAASVLDRFHVVTRTEDVLTVLTAAAVLLLGWLAVRRRLTLQAQVALSGVLLLTLVFPYRSWLTEPLVALVSLTGVSAALLAGLLWRLLTDLGYARTGSPGFPQASRVLVALASSLVGVTFAAQVALLGGRSDLDLAVAEQVGDSFLGFPLVLAVCFTGLALAARGPEVSSRAPS